MEPKDLKNPDGLKGTTQDADSKKDENVKKEETTSASNSSDNLENKEKSQDAQKNEVHEDKKTDEPTKKSEEKEAQAKLNEEKQKEESRENAPANPAPKKKKESKVPKKAQKQKKPEETSAEKDLPEDKPVDKTEVNENKAELSKEKPKEESAGKAPVIPAPSKKKESKVPKETPEKEESKETSAEKVLPKDKPVDKTEEKETKAELSEEKPKEESSKNTSETPAPENKKESEVSEETPTEEPPKEASSEKVEKENSQDKPVEAENPEKQLTDKKKENTQKQAKSEEVKKIPDYNEFNQVELVNAMRDLLEKEGDHYIRDEIEAIKAAFYKQVKEEKEQKKKEFLEDGGNEEDYKPEDNPYEQDIKDLLKRFRQIKANNNKKLEQEKEMNLQAKYDVIEEIKGLINKEESINKTFNDFRDLQQRWREIGLVPQSKMKDLWDTYHFHVENFYDYIKINKELRDLDLKKNLEMKIRLCEQAEELLLEPNIIKAFNALQKLHERWREIGPVPRENKDDIWERFKASTSKINKKHQEYYENRKADQKKNLEAKRALCEQVEKIIELDLNSHKEWGEKSKEVINLQQVWRTIGFAPRKDNNKIYERFRKACDTFFDAKRDFYAKNKELQQNNLQMKIDLCVQAESLKDSTDWRKTTQDLINIQRQWKEIGPVPRKQSEAIWKRFRAACDHFFNKKSEHFSNIDSEQVDNLKLKEQLINDVLNFEAKDDADENLQSLKDFQRRWTEIGHVPIKKKDAIQKSYREAINKLFDDLNLDESKRNLLKFRTKMASFSESSRGQNKMRFERDKYINKMKQLENDLILLDNNVGFFAKSKNAESLIEDVKRKIEQTKEKIELLKKKIRVIDEMDNSEE